MGTDHRVRWAMLTFIAQCVDEAIGVRHAGRLVQGDDEVTLVQSVASYPPCPFATRCSQD